MCRKLIYLVYFVLVLGVVGNASADLVAYWPLDADAKDIFGGHDGILVGGAQFTDDPERGRVLSVNGIDGRVEIPHSDELVFGPTDSLTIAVWLNIRTLPGNWAGIVNKSRDMGSWYGIWVTPGNQWHFDGGEGGTNVRMDVGTAMTGWLHLAGVYDADRNTQTLYVDGAVIDEYTGVTIATSGAGDVWFGGAKSVTEFLNALIDDVRIYNHALTEEEIQTVMLSGGEGYPFPSRPNPEDGALHLDTWVSLSWRAGDFAVSHDVYLGDNFDDVNEGVSDTFQGNQAATYFVAGFPGFPYPDGLVPGTTYYWRIDEVNDTDPNSPWKGPVWSFTVPPKTAYNPSPGNGAKFIDPNENLSWTAGFGAKLHTVYFGDNFDDVNNATGGLPRGITTYALNTLELKKTYYWRVDEFDAVKTYKGDIWSFTTAGAGGGVRADYFRGMDLRNLVLSRIDPQINFNWGDPGSPDASVPVDQFSARWTGEVEAAFTETYTFYTNSDDGIRLWVDGQQLVDNWTDHGATENRGSIDLVAGNTYSVVMEFYENGGGAVAELRWSSPSTPKQFVPQAALSLPVKASRSKPSNGAVDVKQTAILSWSLGDYAASHQLYFGTDKEVVRNANTGSPEYKGSRNLGSESYDPGKLEWDTTYYWRVDEVNNLNPDSPWVGNVWSFTTADFLIVDDFEDYDIGNNEIWWAWKDGLGYAAHGNEPAYPGNGTGSAVGDESTASYTEETIVHGGKQSMPLFYDNSVLKYSEAQKTLTYPRDWTENGVNTLSIWFRGLSDNAAEMLYVALNGNAIVTNDNPNAAQIDEWIEWTIDLQAFADQGVSLANVNTIALGLGNKKNPVAGGSGTMYFDDIRLYRPAP